MTKEEKTLSDAMSYVKVTELPAEHKASNMKVWTRAIVKVRKFNNTANYAIAVNTGSGSPRIVKDFGDVVAIAKVENIYPYEYLSEEYIPNLRNKKEIIAYLESNGYEKEKIAALLDAKTPEGVTKSDEDKANDRQTVKSYIEDIAFKNFLSLQK